jgi:hypothetical protein
MVAETKRKATHARGAGGYVAASRRHADLHPLALSVALPSKMFTRKFCWLKFRFMTDLAFNLDSF